MTVAETEISPQIKTAIHANQWRQADGLDGRDKSKEGKRSPRGSIKIVGLVEVPVYTRHSLGSLGEVSVRVALMGGSAIAIGRTRRGYSSMMLLVDWAGLTKTIGDTLKMGEGSQDCQWLIGGVGQSVAVGCYWAVQEIVVSAAPQESEQASL